jgi:hypothetical protein
VAGEILDVHTAVSKRATVLVRFGDLGFKRDDALEAGAEIVGHAVSPIVSSVEPPRPWVGAGFQPVILT